MLLVCLPLATVAQEEVATLGPVKRPAVTVDETLQSLNVEIRVPPPVVEVPRLQPQGEIPVERPPFAIMPFENLTEVPGVENEVMALVRAELQARGISILPDSRMVEFMRRHRVRYRGFMPGGLLGKLKEELQVDYLLVGTVVEYDAGNIPTFGLHTRVLDTATGRILWANYNSHNGADFESVLGLGIITSMQKLQEVVIGELLSDFSLKPGAPGGKVVAVIPFKNITERFWAGRAVTYMLITELWRQEGVEPIDVGDVKDTLVRLNIRHRSQLSYPEIDSLKEALGIEQVLIGTLEEYSRATLPRVLLSARLIDVRTRSVLSQIDQELDGDDEIKVFDFGRLRSVDRVAYRAVSHLVERLKERVW